MKHIFIFISVQITIKQKPYWIIKNGIKEIYHCYEVTFVNPAKQPKVQIYNCAKYQRYVKGAERKQSRGLAILLYVDWLPQANGFAASSIIYRRGSLLQKNCLVPT